MKKTDYQRIRTAVLPRQRLLISSEELVEELPGEHGSGERRRWRRRYAEFDVTVVVELDEVRLKRLIGRAVYNASRKAAVGPLRVRIITQRELPDTRTEELS